MLDYGYCQYRNWYKLDKELCALPFVSLAGCTVDGAIQISEKEAHIVGKKVVAGWKKLELRKWQMPNHSSIPVIPPPLLFFIKNFCI